MLKTGVNHTTAVYDSEQEALRYQSSGLLLLLPCCRLTTAAPTACQTLLPTAFNPSCPVAIITAHSTVACPVQHDKRRRTCRPTEVVKTV